MTSFGYEPTPAQLQAVEHPGGNLQLIACAGSGKTDVLARRIARLLDPDGPHRLEPRNIVAFTFTEKAATELRHRITERVQAELGDLLGLSEMFVGTIHGFCLQLLQDHVPEYRNFKVFTDVQQALFIDRYSRQSGFTESFTIDGKRLLRRFSDTDLYRQALDILREDEIDWDLLWECSVALNLDRYQGLLSAQGYFDYSALLETAGHLLRDDAMLRTDLADRIAYVIVDEYQDINPVQERIIALLHELGANLCVVGDDDQAIYQWRGSTVENITGFAGRYPGVAQVRLQENFRSSVGIVEIARDFIAQNPGRLEKQMQPSSSQEYEVGDISALEFSCPEDEADWIAETCRELHGKAFGDASARRGLSWSDMAILLRSVRRNGDLIIEALRRHQIPFVVKGTTRLFRTPEVQAMRLAYQYIVDIDVPTKEADNPTPDEIDVGDAWLNAGLGIRESDLAQAISYLTELQTAIGFGRQPRTSIQAVLLTLLTKIGLREDAIPAARREDVMFNLGKFSQLVSDYEAIHALSYPQDLFEGFVKFLYYQAEEVYQEGPDEHAHAEADAVQVMTVHQAKGMQWPVVFIPALLRNRFPAAAPGGASVWDLIPAEAVANAGRYRTSDEDEARLFYVAMTRSQKFLHMTWAPIGSKGRYYRPSTFWERIRTSKWVLRERPDYTHRPSALAQPASNVDALDLSFTNLRHFLRCPYEFKLRVLYGFNEPNDIATGYGAALHSVLAEIHTRAGAGQHITSTDIHEMVELHMRLPFAGSETRETLKASARKTIAHYVQDRSDQFQHIQFVEKDVEVNLDDNTVIRGRIDLVERHDIDETTIIDLKSNRRSQSEAISEQQLHTYTLGYQQLTGWQPDFVEIYDLEGRSSQKRMVDQDFVEQLVTRVRQATEAIRQGSLIADPSAEKCGACGVQGLCSAGERAHASGVQVKDTPSVPESVAAASKPWPAPAQRPGGGEETTAPIQPETVVPDESVPKELPRDVPAVARRSEENEVVAALIRAGVVAPLESVPEGLPQDLPAADQQSGADEEVTDPIPPEVAAPAEVAPNEPPRDLPAADQRSGDGEEAAAPIQPDTAAPAESVPKELPQDAPAAAQRSGDDEEAAPSIQPDTAAPAESVPKELPQDAPDTVQQPTVFQRLRRRLSRWSRR